MRIISLKNPSEIFIDIREQEAQIQDIYSNKLIPIKEYVLLYSSTGEEFKFLGLNKTFNINYNLFSDIIERKSFWLRNSELFAAMCSILFSWLDIEKLPPELRKINERFKPFDWIEFLKPQVISIDPERNWFAFLVDFTDLIKQLPDSPFYSVLCELESKGFILFITAQNSFRTESLPNIYFQICSLKNHGNSTYYEPGSGINVSLLTLEKTNFKVTYNKNPEELFSLFPEGYSLNSISRKFKQVSSAFELALTRFNALYNLMQTITMDEESYDAIVLDLYDRNRSISSIDLDIRLKRLIAKSIVKGKVAVKGNKYNWATLIDSVIINNSEEILTKIQNNPYELTHLFSKKMVIQKMERIYETVLSRENPGYELRRYISEQVSLFREIKPILYE